jgi:DNA-binding MarR family transcriptional regulator
MARAKALPAPQARLPNDGELFFKLVRVVNITARPFVEKLARKHRLSLNEWRVMIVLASHPGCAAHQIVDATGLDKMSVSRAIAALERHGRISKRADPHDARRALLELNRPGWRLYENLGSAGRARELELFARFDDASKLELEALVDRLIDAIQAADAAHAP